MSDDEFWMNIYSSMTCYSLSILGLVLKQSNKYFLVENWVLMRVTFLQIGLIAFSICVSSVWNWKWLVDWIYTFYCILMWYLASSFTHIVAFCKSFFKLSVIWFNVACYIMSCWDSWIIAVLHSLMMILVLTVGQIFCIAAVTK